MGEISSAKNQARDKRMNSFIYPKKGKIFLALTTIFLLVFWGERFHLVAKRRLR